MDMGTCHCFRFLLQKILDCHLGLDRKRTSLIPQNKKNTVARRNVVGKLYLIKYKGRSFRDQKNLGSPIKRTTNQINTTESKKKTDYENLLLLKKILGAKPSKYVRDSFAFNEGCF